MTSNVIGEMATVSKGRTFSGGESTAMVTFELKVPSIMLPNRDLQLAWIARGSVIILEAASGKVRQDRIWGNVVHAIDGLWGINGHAYTNAELGAALSGQTAPY